MSLRRLLPDANDVGGGCVAALEFDLGGGTSGLIQSFIVGAQRPTPGWGVAFVIGGLAWLCVGFLAQRRFAFSGSTRTAEPLVFAGRAILVVPLMALLFIGGVVGAPHGFRALPLLAKPILALGALAGVGSAILAVTRRRPTPSGP